MGDKIKIPAYKGGPVDPQMVEDTEQEERTHKDYRPPTIWERLAAFIKKHLKLN